MSNSVPKLFGTLVFNDKVMKERLPKETYKALRHAVESGTALGIETANVIANAMKDWAIEKGATHYTHWFQPMTGITAEKHDGFLTPIGEGEVIMNFSGKELIKGEPDASSFPSGGIRATFEARGYTAWDPSSYAFIKNGALCIPTAFMSYTGEVLDKKTPLLRSMNVLGKQAARVLKLFGKNVAVNTTVGPEQEYFLIDRDMYLKRSDLMITGRTLLGARPPKGQELEDHYFGNIKPRVMAFMQDLDRELWKFGIYAKTRHNEVAPAQHELAPVFASVNIATDHNQLTMEIMKKVAEEHGLHCLLHEKPFAGVNGSGKHNNWSMSTSEGENLLSPGKNPENNLQFLLFLTAVIEAVDKHQDLLRLSVASAGNDHRLGANEAPPAIISIFLGDELTSILENIECGKPYCKKGGVKFTTGVDSIPLFTQDTTDRNRTSPFAFTGNKFEFRMLGSAVNISCPNVMINTAVAEALDSFAGKLEKSTDFEADVLKLIKTSYAKHKRIVFNGNNYSKEWEEEAAARGLLNLKSTPDALIRYDSEENVKMFEKFKIYTAAEIRAREEILLENYSKVLNIEALTMIDMVNKQILPAVYAFSSDLAEGVARKGACGVKAHAELDLLKKISALTDSAYDAAGKLSDTVIEAKGITDFKESAFFYRDNVLPAMQELRMSCDALETMTDRDYWPIPTYCDLLFY
ncbi:MAG: glutamine synthetase type III [Clostridia bacterium]|nr:glutamine synthetase type III [Clostridia bacterium]